MSGRRRERVAATELRLRDAFAAAAETVDPGSIPGPPWPAAFLGLDPARRPSARAGWPGSGRRARWSRLPPGGPRAPWLRDQVLAPLAAAMAVTVIAVTMTAIVPKFLPGHQPPSPGGSTAVRSYDRALGGAGPRYFVGIRRPRQGVLATASLEVYSAISGHTVARLKPPGQGRSFQAVATFGSDRTFVAAASTRPGAKACTTWFYRFSLGSGGRPVNLAQLSAWTVPGVVTGVSALAASADGKMVAYSTRACATPLPVLRLGVINVSSGRGTAWTTRSTPRSLSLSPNGALLSFLASPGTSPARDPHADAAWVVPTSAPPGPLSRHYRKAVRLPGAVSAAALSATQLSSDESLLFAITGHGPPNEPVASTVAGYDARLGTLVVPVRALAAGSISHVGLSVSVSGRFALVYLLQPGSVQELNLAGGQLRTVPVAAADGLLAAAW